MSKDRVEKLKELDTLRAEIKEREDRIDQILNPEKQIQVVLPANFSIYDEIKKILKDSKESLSNATIQEKLKTSFPNYGIDTRKVNSAMVYLKKRGDVETTARARYKIKIETESTKPVTGSTSAVVGLKT